MPLDLLNEDVLFKNVKEEIFHGVTFRHPVRFFFLENLLMQKANADHEVQSPSWFLKLFAIFWSTRSNEKYDETNGPIDEGINALVDERYTQLKNGLRNDSVVEIAEFVGKLLRKENDLSLAEQDEILDRLEAAEGVQSGKAKPKRFKTKSKALT
jgi:hypothetical protein